MRVPIQCAILRAIRDSASVLNLSTDKLTPLWDKREHYTPYSVIKPATCMRIGSGHSLRLVEYYTPLGIR